MPHTRTRKKGRVRSGGNGKQSSTSPVYQSHWARDGQAADGPLQHQVVLGVLDQRLTDGVGPLHGGSGEGGGTNRTSTKQTA